MGYRPDGKCAILEVDNLFKPWGGIGSIQLAKMFRDLYAECKREELRDARFSSLASNSASVPRGKRRPVTNLRTASTSTGRPSPVQASFLSSVKSALQQYPSSPHANYPQGSLIPVSALTSSIKNEVDAMRIA